MAGGPRQVTTAPPASAPRVGLLSSAIRPDDGDDRWANGIAYEPENCYSGAIDNPCDSDEKDSPAPNAEVDWKPYTVYATYRCTALVARGKDWDGIVRRRLAATEGWQIEQELWSGFEAVAEGWPNHFLAMNPWVNILTEEGPVGLTHGLACLEQYLAENNGGQQGMIHATRQVVTHWQALNLIRREGQRLFTVHDNIVVPGGGYEGGPPGPVAGAGGIAGTGNVWAYATDLVEVRLSPVKVFGSPDEPWQWDMTGDGTSNTAVIRAERMALASWELCRHAGVRLDVTVCGMTGS